MAADRLPCLVRRLWPKSKLRSDVYWKIVAFENRHHVMARLDARRGKPARERVVQDVEIPLDRTAEFLDWFLREVQIEPVWLLRTRTPIDRYTTLVQGTGK